MNPAFELPEYERRLEKVRRAMSEKNLDALVIGDPANMNWLTGFDAWSFYVPQVMLVLHDQPPARYGPADGLMRLRCAEPPEQANRLEPGALVVQPGNDGRHQLVGVLAELLRCPLRQQGEGAPAFVCGESGQLAQADHAAVEEELITGQQPGFRCGGGASNQLLHFI